MTGFMKYFVGPFQIPIIGNILYMLPAVLKLPKEHFESFTSKYWKYKPAYIIMDEISKIYGPIANLQFGINHASKFLIFPSPVSILRSI